MGRFVLFIAVVQSILFLGHGLVYRTLVRFLGPINPPALSGLRITLGLLSISLVATSLLSFRYDTFIIRLVYTAAAAWLGILYLLVLASACSWVLYGLIAAIHLPVARNVLLFLPMGAVLIAILYGFINAWTVRITSIEVQLTNCPAAWRGRTAAWVSDTHLGHVRNRGFSEKIAQRIRGLHPDIVFLGGDLYDGQAVDLDRVIEPFAKISAPLGIYFITGNHEEFSDKTRYLQAVRRAGIQVLDNERVEIDGVQIIGVDYRDTRGKERFKSVLGKIGIERSKPSILLKHVPLDLPVAEEHGITFQISGHTHRGQVLLFRFITERVYEGYDYGLKRFGNLLIYTSSGAGTWGPPMRIDTVPEIVFVTFR
jgi:uncharacterized protein